NTILTEAPASVLGFEKGRIELGRSAGKKVACEERLVARGLGGGAATTGMECEPGFCGKLGTAAAAGGRLRIAFSSTGAGGDDCRTVSEKSGPEQSWARFSGWWKAANLPDADFRMK